jgi:FKBP-type peptidyl-prolyl cis-trans isomerase
MTLRTVKILLASSVAIACVMLSGCSKSPNEPTASDFKPAEAKPLPPPPTKLEITDTKEGTGAVAKAGDTVKMQYTGTLMNGEMFDTSVGKDPFSFKIGQGQVIKGWDQGIPGMKVGGKRTLVIPPDLGYGAQGSPPKIPANAGLKFDVELLAIEPGT